MTPHRTRRDHPHVRHVHRAARRHAVAAAGAGRAARAERGRQVHAAQDPDGAAPAVARHRPRARPADLGGDRDAEGNWRLRRLIGFMPEADALVPGLTGVEYVALAGELYGMPRRQAQRRAHEVLSYLELEEARYRRSRSTPTGMKQRAKLAQALVHDPPVLLLDEPTSGLDPAGRDAMLRLVPRARHATTASRCMLSTHLLADVEAVCERVVILAGGRVRGQGTVERAVRPPAGPLPLAGAGRPGRVPRRAGGRGRDGARPTTARASGGWRCRPAGRTWRSSSWPT